MTIAPSFDGTQTCMQVDPELFFPELPERPTLKDKTEYKNAIQRAKMACSGCKFLEPCLSYAVTNDVVGVWGATTERERSQIRREKGIPTPKSMTLLTNAWVNQKGAR